LKLIFGKICTLTHLFSSNKKKEKLHQFLEAFFKGLNIRIILESYKETVHNLNKKESSNSATLCVNLIKNAFEFILSSVLMDNISLKVLPYLIETLVFCLRQEALYSLGCEQMYKIYETHSHETLQKAFENEVNL
jgi:hypothetical protein